MKNPSLHRALIEQIFDAASIRRWNDQINPMEFTELDKQAHKMIIAWVLSRCEEDRGRNPVDESVVGQVFQELLVSFECGMVFSDGRPCLYEAGT